MLVDEEQQPEIYGKKRPRVKSVHLEPNSPERKRVHGESAEPIVSQTESERFKDDITEAGVTFLGPEQIREKLLGILSDSDELTDDDSAINDLDSVIKSLQDELNLPQQTEVSAAAQPDLGYLLEASDDELGLPPASTEGEANNTVFGAGEVEVPVISLENFNFGKMFEFEDEFLSYDCGIVEDDPPSGDFVLDGLFCYNERKPSDQSELTWQRRLAADPTALTG